MIKNASLTVKLLVGFIVVSIITALVGLIGFIGLSDTSKQIHDLGNMAIPTIVDIEIQKVAQLRIRVILRTLMSSHIPDEMILEMDEELDEIREYYNSALSNYNRFERTEEESELYQDFLDKLAVSKIENNLYLEKSKELLEPGADRVAITEELYEINLNGEVGKAFGEMYDATDRLLEYIKEYYGQELVEEYITIADRLNLIILIGATVGVLLAITLGIVISRSITKPVNVITNDLFTSSGSLESASQQVSSSSQELSSGASELASSVEEMTSSLEELQSIIESNTKNITEGSGLMNQANNEAAKSTNMMKDLRAALEEIYDNSMQVSKVIKVIDDIAFQTNILALNAAVEAARAGEAGAGFAVVADQVKNLAQKSADAAKETASLIEKAINSVKTGGEKGTRVQESTEISGNLIEKVNSIMDEINRASQEQLKGANQVTKAVGQINNVVQQTASTSEETAASGEELMSQAEMLAEIVRKLNTLVNGLKEAEKIEAKKSKSRKTTAQIVHHSTGGGVKQPVRQMQLSHKEDDGVEVIKPEDKIPMEDFDEF